MTKRIALVSWSSELNINTVERQTGRIHVRHHLRAEIDGIFAIALEAWADFLLHLLNKPATVSCEELLKGKRLKSVVS